MNVELAPLLAAVGFRVKLSFRMGINIRRDRDILRWARTHGYIYVCHDRFKDRATRMDVYPELYWRGGKVLRIGGGPEGDIHSSLGKILVHRQFWKDWFLENDGIVTVASDKVIGRTAERLYQFIDDKGATLATDPVATLRHRQRQSRPRRVPSSKIPPLQSRLALE